MMLKKILAVSGRAKPGFVEYATPGTYIFEVPEGYNKITVCMIGGGGSGAAGRFVINNMFGGGGYAGQIVNQTLTVQPKQQITITVGGGGLSDWRCDSCGDQTGNPGAATTVGGLTATGGAGGTYSTSSDTVAHKGNGESRTVCVGTTNNGVMVSGVNGSYSYKGYGGQAGLGNGGNGTYGSTTPSPGQRGGGGGCGISANKDQASSCGGKGGDGYVKISWGI